LNGKEQKRLNEKNGTQGIPQEQRRHKLAKKNPHRLAIKRKIRRLEEET